ncbi:MAG: glycosyltransferase [Candidatus Dojkabacteria bacterium]
MKDLKEKNILYLVHNYASFQKDQIEETSKAFNKVYVLVRYKPISILANLFPFKFLEKYKEENCVDLSNIPSNIKIFKTLVFYLPVSFLFKMLGDQHYQKARKIISGNNIKFDIIHAHFLWSSGYVAMKLAEEYNVPFVVTGHGYDVYSLQQKGRFWKEILELIVEKADKIITISSFNKKHLEKLSKGSNKIEIIHNGFSSSLFYPMEKNKAREELHIDKNKKVCLIVGNLIELKGHEYLIKAFSLLPKGFNDVVLYVVGGGPLQSKLECQVRKLKLNGRINFVGIKPHSELVKWMNSADLFLISSLVEGGPVVLLESLACGVPVVGTKVGIIPETITTAKYGIICKTKDPISLRDGIVSGFSKEWSKSEIAEYGGQFTWVKATDKLIKIYFNLLDKKTF